MPRPAPVSNTPSPESRFTALNGVADNAQALTIRIMLGQSTKPCLYITHHDRQLEQFVASAQFFLPPDIPLITLPAWDTLPYDRSAPARAIIAARVAALTDILHLRAQKLPFVVVTTANAFLQKLPPARIFDDACMSIHQGGTLDSDNVSQFLVKQGYRRASKVMEAGEFAVRGSIIDIFPSNGDTAYRLDMFDDMIESIKAFDPLTQRSDTSHQSISIAPTSEILLNDDTIASFRKQYREMFGQPSRDDALYHTVSEGNAYLGMEHWLPLFYDTLDTITDYLPEAQIVMDHGLLTTLEERDELIHDYYQARQTMQDIPAAKRQIAPYNAVPPEQFFLSGAWHDVLRSRDAVALQSFDGISHSERSEESRPSRTDLGQRDCHVAKAPRNDSSLGLRASKKPYVIAKSQKQSPIEYAAADIAKEQRTVIISGVTQGSCERLQQLFKEQHLHVKPIAHWHDVTPNKAGIHLAHIPINAGFQSDGFVIYTEEDLLGRTIIQTRKRKKAADTFMQEAASFEDGELLVHKDHGIGRFDGLVTMDVKGSRHDFLKLSYRDDDRLFLPVENMELINRHGSEAGDVELDKLGAGSWQARKAAFKEKLRMTAEELLKTAAERELSKATPLHADDAYSAFAARFPYSETEDQERAIEEVIDDLQTVKPMDRLICGDVGFGKTEVAIRAAFIAATDAEKPVQVAFIAPTTLLARQHYKNFVERFADTGLRIAQLSRLCTTKQAKEARVGIADGTVDIVIGTHALLTDSLKFKNLGLLIIDEEQRFGVKQKEKLKSLKSDLHVLTMSATPIPRTLQMALSGVRELSLITTPPVDRLAIRSFVMPFDPVVIQEAIKREMHRGGQVFYVTPRIADLAELKARITELVPEARLAVAHGQMAGAELDALMNDVYDGKYDILLSTSIIESGIDIPTANTMIINRADRFGLAQLYQLRGRVGRGKVRAYAYFTLPYHGAMTAQAVKRLEVMQTLDTLGAGFTLASHDMDIRGFGNLVGEEQSGHVKEVGIELYQHMLADAVKQARERTTIDAAPIAEDDWSPQLNLGLSVLIPEHYVEDVSLRLSLYRRVSSMESAEEIESFAAELADRFGAIPEEAEALFTTLKLKQRCRAAGIAKIDTGPKGAVIHFHASAITNPEALIGFIHKHTRTMKLRADQSLFYASEWKNSDKKLSDISQLIDNISALQKD